MTSSINKVCNKVQIIIFLIAKFMKINLVVSEISRAQNLREKIFRRICLEKETKQYFIEYVYLTKFYIIVQHHYKRIKLKSSASLIEYFFQTKYCLIWIFWIINKFIRYCSEKLDDNNFCGLKIVNVFIEKRATMLWCIYSFLKRSNI